MNKIHELGLIRKEILEVRTTLANLQHRFEKVLQEVEKEEETKEPKKQVDVQPETWPAWALKGIMDNARKETFEHQIDKLKNTVTGLFYYIEYEDGSSYVMKRVGTARNQEPIFQHIDPELKQPIGRPSTIVDMDEGSNKIKLIKECIFQ